MNDTDPITLDEACELVWRNKIGVDTLRRAATQGKLSIFRQGRRDFTTLRDCREYIERCREEKPRPASTSTRSVKRGSSATVGALSELAGLENDLRKLRAN